MGRNNVLNYILRHFPNWKITKSVIKVFPIKIPTISLSFYMTKISLLFYLMQNYILIYKSLSIDSGLKKSASFWGYLTIARIAMLGILKYFGYLRYYLGFSKGKLLSNRAYSHMGGQQAAVGNFSYVGIGTSRIVVKQLGLMFFKGWRANIVEDSKNDETSEYILMMLPVTKTVSKTFHYDINIPIIRVLRDA